MNLIEILGIIIVHWFADFVLQTDSQAKGKSKNWSDLINHTANYSSVWFVMFAFICMGHAGSWSAEKVINLVFFFPLITFICHTITDYITSRENSKLWEAGKTHSFFVCIGFDQVLHYAQLFITYYYLTNI